MDTTPYYTALKDINQNYVEAQYAVRGLVPTTAAKIQEEIKGGKQYPFDSIAELKFGNPQTFGQKPISFTLQNFIVLSTLPEINKSSSCSLQYM